MQIAAKQYINRCRAFTLVELILVVGTIGMVTGALVGVIGNSTKDYEYGSERSTLFQDGQAVLDQMVRTLRQAKAFSGVTASTNQAGYITYTSADDVNEQFKLNTQTGELEYGQPASLSALTGNVSSLTFTCYDTDAVALTGAVEPNDIKSVQIEMTLTGTQNTVTLTGRVYCPKDITRLVPNPLGLVLDASGNERHGTSGGGPTFVPGVFGEAIQLDGIDDFVEFLFDEDETMTQLTFAMWVRADSLGQRAYTSVFNNRQHTFVNFASDYQIDVDGRNPGSFRVHPLNINQPFGVVTTDWIHLAMTSDGSVTLLYYNGTLTQTINKAGQNFGRYALGRNRSQHVYFEGTIDDFRVYIEQLTEADIGNIMLGGKFGTPVVWWTFDSQFEVVE